MFIGNLPGRSRCQSVRRRLMTRLLLGFVGAVLCPERGASAAGVPVTLTIDPARSPLIADLGLALNINSTILELPFDPQLNGGSDRSQVSGSLSTLVDLAGGTLSFDGTGLALSNSGNWTPAPGQGFNTAAPANYGFRDLSLPGLSAYYAIRNTVFSIEGDSFALAGGGPYAIGAGPLGAQLTTGALHGVGGDEIVGNPPTLVSINLAEFALDSASAGPGSLLRAGNTLELSLPFVLHFSGAETGTPPVTSAVYLRLAGVLTAVGFLPQACIGDANGDGLVGAADYAIWAAQFGKLGPNLSADFDNNGVVGAGDYALWAANFGKSCGDINGASVPEPGTRALLGGAYLTLAAWRFGRRRAH